MKPLLYLDTSVLSAYGDERKPERMEETQTFWADRLPAFDAIISVLVLAEIRGTPDPVRRADIEGLAAGLEVLPILPEAETLAEAYLAHGVFTEKTRVDGTHVAIAVTHGAQYLASWNFKHLVKVTKRRQVNLVNALEGYQPIEIVAPPLL
jgi:hypothetical protein